MLTKAWKNIPICVEFTNTFSADIFINVSFVNAEITKDTLNNRACSSSSEGKTHFWDFVSNKEWVLKIPAHATIKKEFNVLFPVGFDGFSFWCLTYQLNNYLETISASDGMFNVIVRKAKFMSFYVGEVPVDTNIIVSTTSSLLDASWNLLIETTLENKWNVSQTVSISGQVSNIFWYSASIVFADIVLQAWEKKSFSTKNLQMPIDLPSYKWLFTVSLQIDHIPYFSFDVRHPDMKVTKAWVIEKTYSLFFWSVHMIVWIILLFVYWLIMSVKKIFPV